MKFKGTAWLPAVMLFLLTMSGAAWGDDFNVDHDTHPSTDTTHFFTIQAAIDRIDTLLTDPANANKSFRILVKADKNTPYAGPITIKRPNVPIIGEKTSETFITGGSPLVTVNNIGSAGEIRNFTFRNATVGISVGNSSSLKIENCVFFATGTAIQVQNAPSTSIINNTFFNGIGINTNSDIIITNNIFSNNTTAITTQIALNQLSYNDYFPKESSGVAALGDHSIPNSLQPDSNPRFVDPGALDFHLLSGSPCIGTGNPGFPNSFDRTSSDMGAYGGPNSDFPPPAAVTGLQATVAKAGTATVTLSWNPSPSGSTATAYRVYYGAASRGSAQTFNYQGVQATPSSPFSTTSTNTALSGIPITVPDPPTVPTNVQIAALDRALQVSWDTVAGATGYQINYGTDAAALTSVLIVDGATQTSAQITGLTNKTTYFVSVQALAQNRVFAAVTAVINATVAANNGTSSANESAYSQEVAALIAENNSANSAALPGTPEAPTPFPNLKGEGCFIATAAFGFYSAPQVQALRDFRDRYLLTNAPGRAFVAWYYHYGPRGAHFINSHPWLKAPVRVALFPLIAGALVLNGNAPWTKGLLVVLAALLLASVLHRKAAMLRSTAVKKALLTLFLVVLPTLALGAESRPDRPHWSLELKGGAFFPEAANWSKFYGSNYFGEYGGALAYKVLRQLEVGIDGSYHSTTGKGVLPTSQTLTGEVSYEMVPLDLFVLGRAIFEEDQWLVPYAGGGYTRLFYREELKGHGTTQGSVNGFHARGGVQLLLDGMEPNAARSLYHDYGIHHTYFFLEGKYLRALADTAQGDSVNLGGTSALAGFLLEF